MTGSWAGAMGHTQFIPTSYLAYAVDFTGDGKRDIWGDDPTDALASTATYLARHGWTPGQPWGVEVRLPDGFDFAHDDAEYQWYSLTSAEASLYGATRLGIFDRSAGDSTPRTLRPNRAVLQPESHAHRSRSQRIALLRSAAASSPREESSHRHAASQSPRSSP